MKLFNLTNFSARNDLFKFGWIPLWEAS